MKLLKFETATCGPCRMMTPIVEAVTKQLGIEVVKIDASTDAQLTTQYGVTSVPTFIATDNNGIELARHVGTFPKPHLEKWLKELNGTN